MTAEGMLISREEPKVQLEQEEASRPTEMGDDDLNQVLKYIFSQQTQDLTEALDLLEQQSERERWNTEGSPLQKQIYYDLRLGRLQVQRQLMHMHRGINLVVTLPPGKDDDAVYHFADPNYAQRVAEWEQAVPLLEEQEFRLKEEFEQALPEVGSHTHEDSILAALRTITPPQEKTLEDRMPGSIRAFGSQPFFAAARAKIR